MQPVTIPSGPAQEDAVPVGLDAARAPLRVGAAGLHGAGAAILAEAISSARYVLIGEDHLSREIPAFTLGICRLMVPDGLDALAVEIGPEAARLVDAHLRRGDRLARLAAVLTAHPDAFAFQNGRDESDMAAACAALAGPDFQLWGLDQEFLGAPGYLFEQMRAARPGPIARAAIARLAAADRAATRRAIASGAAGDLFLYHVDDRQLAETDAAILHDGGAHVAALFDALCETRAIYLGQEEDGRASNFRRARLMQRTLLRYLAARPRPPRLLFKFGAVHMGKGINALGQRDLGDFVAEHAREEGVGALHIAVYGARGVRALYGGVGRQVRHQPFVLTDDADYAWLAPALPSAADTRTGDWTLVDLRRLRTTASPLPSPAWRDAVHRYELVVIAPELTPSSLIGTR